ncbi:MAG: exonuclease domain-containing protein [Chloroflexi bacterium]|nr:exonuclease domain-containing protein [Chloroflexota bacterium]
MRTLVSLDLETTGLEKENDAILEIGIVKFRGDEVLEEWQSLVDPSREIPHFITELTGITSEMVRRSGIPLHNALRSARNIVGDLPVVGHSVSFDLGFMRQHRELQTNRAVDTFDLAGILVPHASRYSLGSLAKELSIELPATHRALDDARVTHRLYMKCFERAVNLPREVLEEITRIATMVNWSLAEFWNDALEEQQQPGRVVRNLSRRAPVRKFAGEDARSLKPKEIPDPLDLDKVAHLLSAEGPFAQQFPGYEPRAQQVSMLRKVAQTFNEGGISFIEAGTGTGKSVAYLVPAMMWAIQNGHRVVVSTNTINLQEQLADKDVPAVIDILGTEGRAAVMKGKGRYLCPNRLADLRRSGPKSEADVKVLAKILIWLPDTVTGDADELFIPNPLERQSFQRLSAQNPICNANSCSATDCFFHQARRRAESAHVVIVNHALLLADMAVENRALPEYKYLVIDEAHHLEAAATDALTYTMDREELGRVMGELGRTANRRASGLLPDIASSARTSLPIDASAPIEDACDKAVKAVGSAWTAFVQFHDESLEFFADAIEGKSDYTQKVRITAALRNRSSWTRLEMAFDKFHAEMNLLIRPLNTLSRALTEHIEAGSGDFEALSSQLAGQLRFLVEADEQMRGIISAPDDRIIYWADVELRRGGTRQPRLGLNAAPLHVGDRLKEKLWEGREAVVLTSATMRTADSANRGMPSFSYIKDRLEAQDAAELAVDSPFDYKKSTLLYLVSDVPEPNQQGYQQAVEKGLIELFGSSGGRGMALFTSYTALRATAKVVAPALQQQDIMLYEQGDGVSRRVMIDQFRGAERAVMFGTKSFWEGVDIQGDRLSALAICKLPFDVPTDPIFAARSETFENSFNDYSVPETVLRFRQGFGRLIRSRSDRGVIVVFDRRLISKNYGAAFINALPGPTLVRAPLSMLAKHVREWLAAAE